MSASTPRPALSLARIAELGEGLSREVLEAVLDLVPMATLLIEPGTARVTFANAAADRLAGGEFPRGAEAARYHEVYVCTDARGERIPDEQMPGVRAARGERLEGFQMDWHVAACVRSLTIAADMVRLGRGGEETVVLAFEDITPVKAAEAAAREAVAVLDALVDAVPLGVGWLDREGRFVRVNQALADLHGVPTADHVGRTPPEVGGEAFAPVHEAIEATRVDGRARLGQEAVDGRRRLLIDVFPVVSRGGTALGVGVTTQDVTERAALLEAERAARAAAEEAAHRARFLARVSDELSRSLDYDTTLQVVASLAVPERADWCAIDVVERGGLRRVAIAHADPAKERLGWRLSQRYPPAIDDGALGDAVRGRAPVVFHEITDEQLVAAAKDEEHLRLMRELRLSGSIIVPLTVRGAVVGVLTFVFEAPRTPSEEDVELAAELAVRAGVAIENARLYRDRSHIAQVLQRSLLPPRLPDVPGFELATSYRAAGEGNEVGGDFYDVFQRAEDEWVIVLGDVVGKGPEAASLTALARWTLRAGALRNRSPAAVLAELNAALLHDRRPEEEGERFMSAIYCVLAPDREGAVNLVLASAGHPPPLLVRAGGEVTMLRGGGLLLGIAPEPPIHEERLVAAPGDAVVLYTDGASEAGVPGRVLGIDGLVRAVEDVAGAPAWRMADAIESAARERSEGRLRDDLAIVVLRRCP